MYVLGTARKATPVTGLVPNPDPLSGDNWVPGLWMVWAERNIDRPAEWVYCYTDRHNSFQHSGAGSTPSVFRTKKEALQAGIRYIRLVYQSHLVQFPFFPVRAEAGPFQAF